VTSPIRGFKADLVILDEAYTIPAQPTCQKCGHAAQFVVSSVGSVASRLACGAHLADRVTYALGFALRVDVRLVEVTA
jgi:hypothetical protein